MPSFMISSPQDHVAAATRDLEGGEVIFTRFNEEELIIPIIEDTTSGERIAIRAIKEGEEIVEGGWVIGTASCDIEKGSRVHAGKYREIPRT